MANYLQVEVVKLFKKAKEHEDFEKYSPLFLEQLAMIYSELCERFGVYDSIKDNYIDEFAKNILRGTKSNLDRPYSFSIARAQSIARNEVNIIGNRTTREDAIKAGKKKHKWKSHADEKTRPWHLSADGQVKKIDEPFFVGGEYLMFPMDTSMGASVGNILNCRCIETYF